MTGETPEVRSDKRKPKMVAMAAMAAMTFEQGFFGIKMIQKGIFRVCFSII